VRNPAALAAVTSKYKNPNDAEKPPTLYGCPAVIYRLFSTVADEYVYGPPAVVVSLNANEYSLPTTTGAPAYPVKKNDHAVISSKNIDVGVGGPVAKYVLKIDGVRPRVVTI
jgi:hypothetical protein